MKPRHDVYLDEDLSLRLVALAAKPGSSKSGIISAALKAYLDSEGANKLEHLKPTAQVLAESQSGEPLLVATEAGGRIMAFAGDSTWHWWMEGFESQHKRFWRQVILWLARKDETSDGAVWVKLAQRRFALSEPHERGHRGTRGSWRQLGGGRRRRRPRGLSPRECDRLGHGARARSRKRRSERRPRERRRRRRRDVGGLRSNGGRRPRGRRREIGAGESRFGRVGGRRRVLVRE